MNKYINNVHFKITFPITRELNQMFKILVSNLNYNINYIDSPLIICSVGNDFHSIIFFLNITIQKEFVWAQVIAITFHC